MNSSLNGNHRAIEIQTQRVGQVISGSLKEGVTVKLDPEVSVEEMKVGTYAVIEGSTRKFFGLITNVRLAALDQRALITPPDLGDQVIMQIWAGTGIYGVIEVMPLLTIEKDAALLEEPQPVKAIPSHFSETRRASDEDVERVFGEDTGDNFEIGTPVDMESKVRLDLKKLVERSVGVFGKSGTGKTFLTRLLLGGIVYRNVAVNLVFDMHNEYGWEGNTEGVSGKPYGLKRLFGSKVTVVTLDKESSLRRGSRPDWDVTFGFEQIELPDVELLASTLGLTQAMLDTASVFSRMFRKKWLSALLDDSYEDQRDDLVQKGTVNGNSLQALRRKMERLRRYPFITENAPRDFTGALLSALKSGRHVVLEFGRYNDLTAYVLVANLITRRIHEHYVDLMDRAMGDPAQEPRPLVITIEEAHKFLDPSVADQTIFGTIARELRKYKVTLLVVDQRPSAIDEDVLSQVGTRICCLLDNEKDVDAVLSGTSGRTELRSVLARLDSKQQSLIFGHAVPMPLVIQNRPYDQSVYQQFMGQFGESSRLAAQSAPARRAMTANEELFGG